MQSQSDYEALNLHAKVIAMQLQWGLSYKDAAHCLYLAELEKMRGSKQAENLMLSICHIDHEPGQ